MTDTVPAARGLLALLLAAIAAGPGEARAEGGDDPLPGRAALAKLEPKSPFRWNHLLPDGVEAADAPPCRLAKRVAGEDLVFADLDGNGRFDDRGVDGWTTEGNAYVVPFEGPLLVGDREVEVRFSADGKEVRFRATPIPGDPAVLEGLSLLNALRLRNGLPPVSLDPALSRACEAHARYCNINGITHDEVPGMPGYTEEGARAGRTSSVGGASSPSDAVAALYCQFYHRFSITHPETRAIGLGMAGGSFAIDGANDRVARRWKWPVVIPAPGSGGQPLEFDRRERPRPYEGELTPGLPITLLFGSPEVRDVRAELRTGPKGKTAVPFLLSWPGNPAHGKFPDNFFAIALIPEKPLAARADYSFRISFTAGEAPGEVSGVFSTGTDARPEPAGR